MALNPFLNLTPAVPRATGSQRAQNLQAIVQDMKARTAKIQHVKAVGRQTQENIKNTPHLGPSRLSWLQQQLNKN